jgi:tRNA dimethylallyltransferase
LADPDALSATARQALGYKEVIEHLVGDLSLEAAIEKVILRTRQFAVRQERWFRRDPRIEWIDVVVDPVEEIATHVLQTLA